MRRSLPLLALVPAVALAACGTSDSDKVTGVVDDALTKPASLCDHATDNILKQAGGDKAACQKLARQAKGQPKPKAVDVAVDGDKATATFTGPTGAKNTLGLVKDGGDWKIDAVK